MKHIVIVAPYFPPSNMTSGHRCRYIATHLPKYGWKTTVITVDPRYYEEKLDLELEGLLSPEINIIRVKAFPVRPLRLIGDISIRAFWWFYKTLCAKISKEKIDLIYLPIPPNYSAMLGFLMFKKYGIPYVIDYIDPWLNPLSEGKALFSKAWLSYRLGSILEPIALRHVSAITAVAPGYYEDILYHYPWIKTAQCHAMPYGAEEAEYRYLDTHPRLPFLFDPSDGCFHIVYAGGVPPKIYSTLELLFKSLVIFKERHAELYRKLRLHFIGTGKKPLDANSYTVKPMAEHYHLSDIVQETPCRLAYIDVLNHLRNAYATLIIGSSEIYYSPSKVFQLILAQRPIIAILHKESTGVNILKDAGTGTAVIFSEEVPDNVVIDDITDAIYQTVSRQISASDINWEQFQNYATNKIAEKLSHIFFEISDRSSTRGNE